MRAFLASRGIAPAAGEVDLLASRKDACFLTEIREHGVAPFPSTAALARELRGRGVRTAAGADLVVADLSELRLRGRHDGSVAADL
ncbi:hypothetical protein [Planomonospora parontospora]|uniref:hypothetical protein n=1 Tax=Planomonospora parontospora TaxID=58119 RepID=UPI0016706FF0|nr:hypothetical protein [Planomonospora parontospora]GGL58020.1 hypothetical protein GCM10014719_69280 [Planomonospora parontospora subsp. antibiotica]GII19893.1 hypothetical protein Ppa05_66190 [Planomonospora parontospora subsp. antibiotica]